MGTPNTGTRIRQTKTVPIDFGDALVAAVRSLPTHCSRRPEVELSFKSFPTQTSETVCVQLVLLESFLAYTRARVRLPFRPAAGTCPRIRICPQLPYPSERVTYFVCSLFASLTCSQDCALPICVSYIAAPLTPLFVKGFR